MEINSVQKEKPCDRYSDYYIVRFDPCQELVQGELLKALSSSYDFNVKTFVLVYPAYQGGQKTPLIVRSTCNEAFTRLSNEDASLLLPCTTPESRYHVISQQGMVVFGRRLQPGTEVLVSFKGCPWSLNDEFIRASVKYKGELPSEVGTFFGLQLKSNDDARGSSVSNHSPQLPSFSWASPTVIFVGLDRLKPLFLDGEEPEYPEPREFHDYKTHLQYVTRKHDPLLISQERTDKVSVQTGQNVVTLAVGFSTGGTKLQNSKEEFTDENKETMTGLLLDERAATVKIGKGHAWKLLMNEEQIEEVETHPEKESPEHQGVYSTVQPVEMGLGLNEVYQAFDENQPNTSNRRKEQTNQEKQLRQREEWEEIIRTDLKETEQRLRSQTTEKESIETLLRLQLEERKQRVTTLQRQLWETNQQCLEREEQEEILRTDLDEMRHRLKNKMTEKEARETELHQQLEERDQRITKFLIQLQRLERQLREKEDREELLQENLKEMEQQLQDEMTQTKSKENYLHKQLREKDQQMEEIQEKLREMGQQLAQEDEREDIFQAQLRKMEQRLREEETTFNIRLEDKDMQVKNLQKQVTETETQLRGIERRLKEEETTFNIRLKDKDHLIENLQKQVTETQTYLRGMERRLREEETASNIRLKDKDHQIEKLQKQVTEKEEREQRWRENWKKTETRETWFRAQLTEKTQQVLNFQTLWNMKELEWTEKEECEKNLRTHIRELREQLREKENLQGQVREMEDRWRNAQRHLAEKEVETANLRQQVANLEDRLQSELCDWIIPRDEIQISDNSLGAGGWAEVFEGRYCGCSVAVKQIHEVIVSPHNQSLFQREIDIASRCRHPCLLQFIGATNDEGIPLYVTELMETSLRQLLEQRPLSMPEISVIALDVAQALNYLHRKKPSPIIHRDISSGNVLLWRQGNRWRGKVSDYGAAKFKERKMSIGPGCFAYSAPEVNKSSNQTAKIDVYSFGVLLCEMCTFKQFPDPQKRLAQVNMVKNHALRELVRRCLKTNPRERPDMTEVIVELEKLHYNHS
ncbi:myosin-8-like [Stylophora pistillata]|uniref:myosin-8-like n=1 Tax=Stylophora pistillata TaxID=50429 RepID=UPI000C047996|nr:myosin-8-like [Stylophora pistillata]